MTETTNTAKYHHEVIEIEPKEPPCGKQCPLYWMWEDEDDRG